MAFRGSPRHPLCAQGMLDRGGAEWQDEKLRQAQSCTPYAPDCEIAAAVPVPKWRNWQTRYIQGVVPVREWRFESSLRHQFFSSR